MKTSTPRHRGKKSPAQRKDEREFVLALVLLPFLLALLIWFAVRTDNVLEMIGLMAVVWGGTWLDGQRKAWRRARRGSEPAD